MRVVARVVLMPKKSILDPQGKAVASSLHSLGYVEVTEARLGKIVELRLEAADVKAASLRVEEMCRRLLANEIIEDFRFEIVAAGENANS